MADAATIKAIGLKISAIDDYSKTLGKASKDLKGLAKLAQDAKGGGGATVVGLSADSLKGLAGGFDKIKTHASSSLDTIGKFIPALAGLTGIGAAAGLAKVVTGWEAFGSRIDLTAQRLNLPVQKLSELQNAAQIAGASAEDMSSGLAGLQATMNAAVYGRDANAAGLFKGLGIDIGNATDGVKGLAGELPQIANATQRLFKVNPEAAARFLDQVGIGRQLLFVFKDGAAGLADYEKRADRLGTVTQKQADDARALQVAQTELGISVTQLGYKFASEVGPALIPLLKDATAYLSTHEAQIGGWFKGIGDGIRDFTQPAHLEKLRTEIEGITTALGGTKKVLEDMGTLWLVKKLFGVGLATKSVASGGMGILGWIGGLFGIGASGAGALAATAALGGDTPGGGGQWTPETRAAAQKAADAINARNAAHPGLLQRTWDSITGWVHGDRHMASMPMPDQAAASRQAWAFWKGKGFSDAGTAAMVAQEQGESNFNPSALGDHGTAGGSFQWHKDRRDAILKATGIDVWQDTNPNDQREAMYREMHDGIDPQSGAAYGSIAHATSIVDAVKAGVKHVERSGDQANDVWKRTGYADSAYENSLHVQVTHANPPVGTNVTVTSPNPGVTIAPPRVVGAMPQSGAVAAF